MNHENRPANEPENEFEAFEFDQRLDEVEQRLRRARPRPPRIDASAVMRLMDETPAEPSRRPASRRLYRRLAAVAASWTCGAVVGAAVMFLAIDRSRPAGAEFGGEAARAEEQTSSIDQETMVADREATPRRPEAAGERIAREWNADMLRWIAESGRRGISDEPMFRAGMHLVQNSAPRRREARPYSEISRFDDDEDDAMSEDAWRLPSEPPMTRERLMEELLKQTPGHVL